MAKDDKTRDRPSQSVDRPTDQPTTDEASRRTDVGAPQERTDDEAEGSKATRRQE